MCECVYACAQYMCPRVCVYMCAHVCICECVCVCVSVCILEVTKCTFDQILNWQMVESVCGQTQDKAAYRNPKRKLKESVMK